MSNRLTANQRLRANESLSSANGQFQLTLQNDGNLVVYNNRSGSPLWATNTSGRRVDYALMQADGNFVLYSFGAALWATRTSEPDSYLVLEDDGNVVIYNPSNRAVWTTGSLVR